MYTHTVQQVPCPNHEVAPVQTYGSDGCVWRHTAVMQTPVHYGAEVGHVPHVQPTHCCGSDQEQLGLLQEER